MSERDVDLPETWPADDEEARERAAEADETLAPGSMSPDDEPERGES
ncbi:MAG: hypothetical protein ICV74_01665 [Thermoleophilia bacterium]|nr:hypothetical protein [Thermoleophilia bacterium]